MRRRGTVAARPGRGGPAQEQRRGVLLDERRRSGGGALVPPDRRAVEGARGTLRGAAGPAQGGAATDGGRRSVQRMAEAVLCGGGAFFGGTQELRGVDRLWSWDRVDALAIPERGEAGSPRYDRRRCGSFGGAAF